jgi:hypothetical protein
MPMALLYELKGVVRTGHRSYYQKLATSPSLVKLVDEYTNGSPLELGPAVERALIKRIEQIDQSEWVEGVQQTPEALRRSFRELLGLTADSRYYSAPRRRLEAMQALKDVSLSVETWRREPEREFLSILARALESPVEPVLGQAITKRVPVHVQAGQSVYEIVLVIQVR